MQREIDRLRAGSDISTRGDSVAVQQDTVPSTSPADSLTSGSLGFSGAPHDYLLSSSEETTLPHTHVLPYRTSTVAFDYLLSSPREPHTHALPHRIATAAGPLSSIELYPIKIDDCSSLLQAVLYHRHFLCHEPGCPFATNK